MGYEPRLIAPFTDSGLKKYYKPWIIGKEAFPQLLNAYAWRGCVRKREGYRLLATLLDGKPVQGLKTFINPSTLSPNLIGFSTKHAYTINGSTVTDITQLTDGNTAFTFGNTDSTASTDFFWTCNYASAMWATNGLGLTGSKGTANWNGNGLMYLKSAGMNSWNINQPLLNSVYLNGALIVLPYKGRLVVLNTIEGGVNGSGNVSYVNRARWSQIGTPYVASGAGYTSTPPTPFSTDADSWRDDIPGKGGFVDADTSEQIVSAAIVKDTLVVAFQRSTWRLRYTGNEILPFIWERLNTQYGAESTYSCISFDEHVLFFSRYGWIQSDTNDVQRIDLDIPDDSFSVDPNSATFTGLKRIHGIRDYYRQMAVWSFESIQQPNVNQIYCYNYIDRSWTIFNPTVGIRTFGEYFNTSDYVWSSYSAPDDIWANFANYPDDIWSNFGSGQNQGFPFIVGGDASGNVYQMFEFQQSPATDDGTNFGFTIATKRINPYIDKGHKCRLGYVDLYCTNVPGGEITVQHFIDDQSSPIFTRRVATYPRAVLNISTITPGVTTAITTTGFHNLLNGQQVILSDIVGSAGNALNNQITSASVTGPTTFSVSIDTSSLVYTSGGYVWASQFNAGDAKYTRIYLGAIGHMHQLVFTLSPDQIADNLKGKVFFEMQGLVLWTRECGMIRG